MMTVDSMNQDGVLTNLDDYGVPTFTEEQGAKSLNMAANLVALSEGKGVAGLDSDDVKKIFEVTKSGGSQSLEIKNHDEFNKLVGKLNKHADGLWEKGILQKGAAGYIDMKKDTWEDIIEANGLEDHVEGYEVEPGQIQDFEKSDMVNDAEKLLEKVKAAKEALQGGSGILDNPPSPPHIIPTEQPISAPINLDAQVYLQSTP